MSGLIDVELWSKLRIEALEFTCITLWPGHLLYHQVSRAKNFTLQSFDWY